MINPFSLVAKITLDRTEYDQGLKQAGKDLKGFGSTLSGGLAAAAKVGLAAATTAVSAASGALVGLSKAAVSNYSSYEQLVGGVDKLYGEASEKIQQYADNAYKTAGMSANAYMETATSFSAALINSLGGDVDKAADLTDVAMRAMSDNVNVFGSDMESVKNAFIGFSRGQYQLLDNLKIGYGGTKSEMERLIADANEYRASIGQSADLSIDSFADIVQAIQSVQEAQHIAGTTAKEAMGTIEGAAAATKAAWDNVITAIGRGEGVGEAFQGFADSLFGAQDGEGLLNQILPRIETVFNGIASFMATAGPLFADKIPVIVESVLPAILETGVSLINSLADGLVSALPTIMDVGTEILLSLLSSILTLLPRVGEVGLQVLGQLATSLGEAAPTIIPDAVNAIIDTIITLLENADALIDGAVALVMGLTEGIINALPILIERLPEIIVAIIEALVENAPKIANVGPTLLASLGEGLFNALPELLNMISVMFETVISAIIDGVPKLISAGITIIGDFIEGLTAFLPNLLTIGMQIATTVAEGIASAAANVILTVESLIQSIEQGFSNAIKAALEWGANLISSFIEGFMSIANDVIRQADDFIGEFGDTIGNIVDKGQEIIADLSQVMEDGISGIIDSALDWGRDLIDNFIDGLMDKWEDLKSTVRDIADSIKDFLGFSVPEKGPLADADTYAPDMMKLFAKGIKDNERLVTDQIEDSFNFGKVIEDQDFGFTTSGSVSAVSGGSASMD
uniref:phage tail protein n=1 Tax=Selenomonas ruminantium TaxID=971 RepID=UPI0026F09759